MAARDDIDEFLTTPVPPSGTREWREWQDRARTLGPDSAPVLIEALEHAGEAEQYAALLALRLHGYEVWGDGYGPDLVYELTAPGEPKRIIKPKITPAPYEPLP